MDRTFSWKRGFFTAFAIAGLSLCANAGIPEKYGKETDSGYKGTCLRVKVSNQYIPEFKGQYEFAKISYIDYFPWGEVRWFWDYDINNIFDDCYSMVVTGHRTDEAGSFEVESGSMIGSQCHMGNTPSISIPVCIYPMMHLDEDYILLTDSKILSFKVGNDDTIYYEYNGVPSQATVGLGPIEKNHRSSGLERYNGFVIYDARYYVNYPYGPSWQMFTDMHIIPLMPDQNAVEDINDDASDKETPYYDIFGRKINGQPQASGIYIYKGRKIMIK